MSNVSSTMVCHECGTKRPVELSAGGGWLCKACTYANPHPRDDCEVCGSPNEEAGGSGGAHHASAAAPAANAASAAAAAAAAGALPFIPNDPLAQAALRRVLSRGNSRDGPARLNINRPGGGGAGGAGAGGAGGAGAGGAGAGAGGSRGPAHHY